MLRVFILLGLATAVAPDPDCQGVECAQKFVEDAAAKVGARVRQGVRDGIDDMQEAGMPAIVADLGRSVFPAIPEQTSSSSISGDEASASDDTAMDSTLESLPEEFDFDDKLVEFKDDLNPNLVRDLEDENGLCDEDDEHGSCGVEEDHDDVEYAEDKEAEEGPEDGSFEGIDVRSELKALAQGVDVFFYDKNQGAPFDGGVEVRWGTWTASKIYLAPHPDEENAVAVINLKKTMSNGRSGHVYALAKPKADGDRRDFEFANYPAFLVVARD